MESLSFCLSTHQGSCDRAGKPAVDDLARAHVAQLICVITSGAVESACQSVFSAYADKTAAGPTAYLCGGTSPRPICIGGKDRLARALDGTTGDHTDQLSYMCAHEVIDSRFSRSVSKSLDALKGRTIGLHVSFCSERLNGSMNSLSHLFLICGCFEVGGAKLVVANKGIICDAGGICVRCRLLLESPRDADHHGIEDGGIQLLFRPESTIPNNAKTKSIVSTNNALNRSASFFGNAAWSFKNLSRKRRMGRL